MGLLIFPFTVRMAPSSLLLKLNAPHVMPAKAKNNSANTLPRFQQNRNFMRQAQQIREHSLTLFDRCRPHVPGVEFEQVKSA
jgi:hypothetical protein